MRKHLLLLSAALLTAASASAYKFSAENVDGVTIYYDITGSNTASVTHKEINVPTPDYTGHVAIPATVTVTQGSDVTEYTVNEIGYQAFEGCTGLTSVTLPATVTTIQSSVFSGCSSLTQVDFPPELTELGSYVFKGCTSLTSVDLPEGITTLGVSLFNGCTQLTSVTIPSTVTTIQSYAFGMCSSLTSLTLPESILIIEGNAFTNCGVLYNNSPYWEGDGLYIGKYLIMVDSSLTGEYEVKEGTIAIAGNVFWAKPVTKVTLPASLKAIGGSAFESCTSITDIELPDGLSIIGPFAFGGCSGLTELTLPAKLTMIDQWTFKNCTALETLTADMPDPALVTLGSGVFTGVPTGTCTLRVPVGKVDLYRGAAQWSDFSTIIDNPSALEAIGTDAPAADAACYDLTGRRVTRPTSGIYIIGGRKVIMK